MKQFDAPMMTLIHLSNEDVIRSSTPPCMGVTCGSYTCTDCADCVGTYQCLSLTCNAYYG